MMNESLDKYLDVQVASLKPVDMPTDVWDIINEKIDENKKIHRYKWKRLLGATLTAIITNHKQDGLSAKQTIKEILAMEIFTLIKRANPMMYRDMEKNVIISTCARYGEQNASRNRYLKKKRSGQ